MRSAITTLALCLAATACRTDTEPKLQGPDPDPILHTETLSNDLFIVVATAPFGHQDRLALAVAEDGSGARATFVVPSDMALKKGDVFKVHRLCYRAREARRGSEGVTALDACTDVVIPYRLPTPEAEPK